MAWWLLGAVSPLWLYNPSLSERLRILAYHRVPNRMTFYQQIEYLSERFTPIGLEQVERILTGREEVRRPCWVTFDDADPTVVDVALDVLEGFSFPATLYVCPGLVDTNEPYWWQVVEGAAKADVLVDGHPVTTSAVQALKAFPDVLRRDKVLRIRKALEKKRRTEFRCPQMTSDQLRRWFESGRTIGNHSWDHPTLDTCGESEQRRQIEDAHEWLLDWSHTSSRSFAYPNGNASAFAHSVLMELGYRTGLLFDHRLVRMAPSPLELSRLRVNADDSLHSFKARVTGAHPSVHRLLKRG